MEVEAKQSDIIHSTFQFDIKHASKNFYRSLPNFYMPRGISKKNLQAAEAKDQMNDF